MFRQIVAINETRSWSYEPELKRKAVNGMQKTPQDQVRTVPK